LTKTEVCTEWPRGGKGEAHSEAGPPTDLPVPCPLARAETIQRYPLPPPNLEGKSTLLTTP